METKSELRKKAKHIRSMLDMDLISGKIVASIRTLELYQDAQNIMIFYPLPDEINLLPLLRDSDKAEENGKSFYLPKVDGEDLLVCPYSFGDELTDSKFGTKEPKSPAINPEFLDLIFVPALMVDKDFYRLGYGCGFYDRFLSKNAKNAIKIVPIPSALSVDYIPHDEFDFQMDITVDEC